MFVVALLIPLLGRCVLHGCSPLHMRTGWELGPTAARSLALANWAPTSTSAAASRRGPPHPLNLAPPGLGAPPLPLQVGRVRGCTNIPLQHSRWVYNSEARSKEVERRPNRSFVEEVRGRGAPPGKVGAGHACRLRARSCAPG